MSGRFLLGVAVAFAMASSVAWADSCKIEGMTYSNVTFRGLADGQAVIGCPKVERVAPRLARGMEAAEDALAQVDRKRAVPVARRVVQGAGPATLRAGAVQGREVAEAPQDLLHGHLAAEGGEVERPTCAASSHGRWLGVAWQIAVVARGLTHFLPS